MVECGVWRGGSTMLVARVPDDFGDTGCKPHLEETFDGMTEAHDIEVDHDRRAMKPIEARHAAKNERMGLGERRTRSARTCSSPAIRRRRCMSSLATGWRRSQHIYLPPDTDGYRSARHELRHLHKRIVSHGAPIVDDYGWCRGARQATEEFFRDQLFKPMLHRADQGPRMIIKPI